MMNLGAAYVQQFTSIGWNDDRKTIITDLHAFYKECEMRVYTHIVSVEGVRASEYVSTYSSVGMHVCKEGEMNRLSGLTICNHYVSVQRYIIS